MSDLLMPTQDHQVPSFMPRASGNNRSARKALSPNRNPGKRVRKTVSCTGCRRHKLRCDRGVPCGSCKRRDCIASCTYIYSGTTRQGDSTPADGGQLSTPKQQELAPAEGPTRKVSIALKGSTEKNYDDHSSRQWDALLERPTIRPDDTTSHGILAQGTTSLPLQLGPSHSLNSVLAVLPPAHCCDYLITQYFMRLSPMFHILHGPTFQKQYKTFLQNKAEADLAWLSLLFAICSVAIHTLEDDDSVLADIRSKQPHFQHLGRTAISYQLREAAMTSLSLDNYFVNHKLCTLEALLVVIYTISNYEGVERGWALLGLASNIGIALRCNVNVDSTVQNCIERERRRRCWAGILMLHTYQAISFQDIDMTSLLNIPATMPADVNDADVQEDSLLQATMKPTQMSVTMFKLRLFRLSSRICCELSGGINKTMLTSFDAEVAGEQHLWDSTFLQDGSPSLLDTSSYAHWCILQLYAHQLYLLLHRSSCLQRNKASFLPASRSKCLASGVALIDLHRQILELPQLRHYRWYVYGLTGAYAVHGAVALASCLLDGADDIVDVPSYRMVFDAAVRRIGMLQNSSAIYSKAYPGLCHLRTVLSPDRYQGTHMDHDFETSFDDWIDTVPWLNPHSMDWSFWENTLATGII